MLTIQLEGHERVQQRLNDLAGGPAMQRALASGINRTMAAVEQAELNALERDLDEPTPFTMNALRVLPAKPRTGRLNAILFVQPIQAKYLRYAVLGGKVPVVMTPNLGEGGPPLNKYGNIRGRPRKQKMLNPNRFRTGMCASQTGRSYGCFIGEHPKSGVYGLWKRVGDTPRDALLMMVKLERNVPRDKRWDLFGIAQRTAERRLRADVAEAIALAIRSR